MTNTRDINQGNQKMSLTEQRSIADAHTSTPEEPRKRRRGPWVIAVLLVLAGAGAIWIALISGPSEEDRGTTAVETPDFEEAVLTDLTEVTEYDGTIGRLESDPVTIRVSGTVTALPAEGTEVAQGEALVWVNNEPVTLLYGDLPVWRSMEDGTEGPDVLQLETALVALGFDEDANLTVDEEFTSYTESLVEDWQESIGATNDGVVNIGEVAFAAGPLRVDSLQVEVGDLVNEGSAIFTTSSSEIQVTFDLPTTQEGSLSAGDSVEITMPDLSTTTGTVAEIASVASVAEGAGQATFEVIVSLDDPSVAKDIEEAPVTIGVITDAVHDVVAVPVEALLALAEGGYAVEVQAGNGTRLIAVEAGFYADGLIEVTGDLAPGDMVVVP
jgi:peptidoglycan hydrolase-like protein with peptidoglycan-binding domain